MKIIEPSIEIMENINREDILNLTERAGRTCYKSEDRITEDSASKFIEMLIKRGHESVLEHRIITVKVICDRGISHEIVRHRLASYCLSGDTKVLRFNQGRKHLTIKELFDRQNDNQLNGRNKLMILRSMNEKGIIVPNGFKKIFYSGQKEVYEMTTSLGYKIKASKDHIFFNDNGEVKLKDLKVGDKVFVNGQDIVKDKEWLREKYHVESLSLSEISRLADCSYATVRKYIRHHNLQKPLGSKPKNYQIWNKGLKQHEDKRVAKMAKNLTWVNQKGEKNSNWQHDTDKLTDSGKIQKFSRAIKDRCELCGTKENLENHHKDKDISNITEENSQVLCYGCHKLIHKGYNVKKVVLDSIESIELVGVEETYDIAMENPYHNFIANGFVVHNSQESSRYCNYSKEKFGGELNIVDISTGFNWNLDKLEDYNKYEVWYQHMLDCERAYNKMIKLGAKPDEARSVLPNSLKTEIVMTLNLRSWRHFLKLRTNIASHPQIREIAFKILDEFNEHLPEIFEDIKN